jgi:hypothetical protein
MDSARRFQPQTRPYLLGTGLLALLAVLFALPRCWRLFRVLRDVLTGDVIVWDFQVYYTMGYLARHGLVDQIYDANAHAAWLERLTGAVPEASLGFVYPPHFALALAPLSFLAAPVAFRVWFAINCGLMAAVGFILWRLAAPAPRWQRVLLIACVLASDAAYHVIAAGQITALLVLSICSGLLLLRQGRPATAGAALAVLTIKPQLALGILLLFAIRGQWRALGSFAGVSVAFAVATLAYFGPGAFTGNAGVVLNGVSVGGETYLNYTHMHSWRAFLATIDLDQVGAVYAGTALLMAAVAGAGAIRAWRSGPARGDGATNQEWGVALLFPLLLTPHLWTQELLLLGIVAALFLSQAAGRAGDARSELAAAAIVLGGYLVLSVSWSLLNQGVSLTIFVLLAAFLATCLRPWAAESARQRETAYLAAQPRAA